MDVTRRVPHPRFFLRLHLHDSPQRDTYRPLSLFPETKMATKSKSSPKPKKTTSKVKPAPKKVLSKAPPKPAPKKLTQKKSAPKKVSPKITPKKAAPIKANKKKPAIKKAPVAKKVSAAKKPPAKPVATKPATTNVSVPPKPVLLTGFLAKQRQRLLMLKDTLLDSMNGVAKDSLRSRAEGSEASAFGMHQADAGSDAYDRDFALSLLSQEQDSLFEIDQALKRLETGGYGMCEMSGKPIPHARLEALPFARFTVECQTELEKNNRYNRFRAPVTSLFGLDDDDGEEEDSPTDTKD